MICREAAFRALGDSHRPANELTAAEQTALAAALDAIRDDHAAGGVPTAAHAPDGRPVEFSFTALTQYRPDALKTYPSFSALLFGPLFLLYRKVWNWGTLTAVLSLICSIPVLLLMILASNQPSAQPADYLLVAEKVSTVLSLLLQLGMMLFSFVLIRRESAKKIRKLQQTASSPEEFQKLLQAKASPSWVGVVVFILVCVGIGIALQPLFGPHLAEVLFGSTSLF